MKDDSYVVIQAFMVNDLRLKGNELIVYATIYGFTQDGEHWFHGTRGYLAEWCGCTKDTAGNCLKSLVGKGLLERRERHEMGQTFVDYRAVTPRKKQATPYEKTSTPLPKNQPINNLEDKAKEEPKENICAGRKKPTLQEVEEHVRSKGYHFDPRHFWDYYEASGWRMQSGKPVRSWKQCCVTWERNASKQDGGADRRGRYTAEQNAEFDQYLWDPSQIERG